MSPLASLYTSQSPYSSTDVQERASLSTIDQSVKAPTLFFFASAVLWLLMGTLLAYLASQKMHAVEFLADIEWLTFGRIRPAHLNAMIYGWGNNAIFGVAIWMMARLCRTPIRYPGLLYIAGFFWNLGVTIGLFGILKGDSTSIEWLEMPTYVTPLLAFSYLLIGLWGLLCFRHRRNTHVYVSQWYLLGAIFWFPWLYAVAQIMILFEPARGVVQGVTNWWFAHNVLGLWLTPMGLAAAYYFIPKVLGRPIYSYYLSILGFWSLALFYNWAGMHHLIGGPVPAWILSAGTVGSVMMVIPVLVTAINHHMTVVGMPREVWRSPTLRFIVFGAIQYTLVSLAGSTMALRSVNEVTHFTHFTVGHAHHGVYAFFTMVMFGSIYYIMPRLVFREWPSAFLIRVHFWCTAVGICLMIGVLHWVGWFQGLKMNNPDIPFLDIVEYTKLYLVLRTASGILITVGHVAFAINIYWMIFKPAGKEDTTGTPTLLVGKQEQEA